MEKDRKTINACKILLRILHPQPVRKMIPVNYATHLKGKPGKGKIRFKLLRSHIRRTMNPTKTEYPTSALDKGKIGDKQTRLDERNKFGRKGKKGGEVNYVYNTKFSIPTPSQSTVELSKVSQHQTHPFTILSDIQDGSTQQSRKQREKRKREHNTKDGKQQKLQESRKSGGKEPDADKKTGRKKIVHKHKIHRENIAPTVRIGHINPRGMLTPGKILSLQKLASAQHLDVLALTETHLTEHNLDLVHEVTGKWRLIIIPSPFRQNSQQGKGGIALMVKEHISATPREKSYQ